MSLREIVRYLSTVRSETATCEACGNEFRCGASLAGCWCSEIKLSDEARAELRARYRNCLCRECLEKIAVPQKV